MDIGNIFFYTCASILGWILIATLAQACTKGNKFLAYAGKKSIWILGLHFLSFKVVSYIVIMITHTNTLQLAYYPVIRKPEWIWVMYFIFGVILPLMIQYIFTYIKNRIRK